MVACSKRSDSGERCRVKKAMKSSRLEQARIMANRGKEIDI